jgi:hypothetical protein
MQLMQGTGGNCKPGSEGLASIVGNFNFSSVFLQYLPTRFNRSLFPITLFFQTLCALTIFLLCGQILVIKSQAVKLANCDRGPGIEIIFLSYVSYCQN